MSRSVFWRLSRPLRGERCALLWVAVVNLIANLSLVALSVVAAHIIAYAAVHHRADEPAWWCALVILTLARPILTWHEMDSSHSVAYRVLAALRLSLFDGFARGIPRREGGHSGLMASTAMADVEKLEFFYAHTIAQLAAACALAAVSIPVLGALTPSLALVVVAGALLVWSVIRPTQHLNRRLGSELQERRAELSAATVDALSAVREALLFDQVEPLTDRVQQLAVGCDALSRKLRLVEAVSEFLRGVVVTATGVCAALLGARAGLDPVWLPCLLAGAMATLAPIAEAIAVVGTIQSHRASAERVLAGIELKPEPACHTTSRSASHVVACLRGVEFVFPGRPPLRLPDLTIERGEHVGLRGPSGTGKSTVARLLTGLWSPDRGEVLIGGKGVGAWSAEQRASIVQLVEQDAPIFHGTLADNLLLGNPHATREDMQAVLSRVGLGTGASTLSEGLDTRIGEAGVTLSGGERARVCLARALLMRPALLVLDETTAALDAETERSVMDVVGQLECAVLVISHRISTLTRVPRVIDLTVDSPGHGESDSDQP